MQLLRKAVPRKRWVQVYCDRVEEKRVENHQRIELKRAERWRQMFQDEEHTGSTVDDSASRASSISGRSTLSCKHTLDSLPSPTPPQHWEKHWGSRAICYLCAKPALSDVTMCGSCNLVVHVICLVSSLRGADLPSDNNHVCPNCKESIQAEEDYYARLGQQLEEQRQRAASADIITRRAKIFLAQRMFAHKRAMAVLLQSFGRGMYARKRFQILKRSILRVVIVEFLRIPQLLVTEAKHALIIVTVVDPIKGVQIFRFDRRIAVPASPSALSPSAGAFASPTVNGSAMEHILIPGIAYNMAIVISLTVKEEVYNYAILGQATISLKDMYNTAHKKDLALNFVDKVEWPPQDAEGVKSLTFTSSQRYWSSHPGNNVQDLSMVVRYAPQNPACSLCQMAFAPPLDLLRRSAELHAKLKKNKADAGAASHAASLQSSIPVSSASYRNSRYWICLLHTTLWFYHYYGDTVPRFGTSIADAVVTIVSERSRATSAVSLTLADQRVWLLEFSSKKEARRFEFAINEIRKAMRDGRSMYVKSSVFFQQLQNFGFQSVPYF